MKMIRVCVVCGEPIYEVKHRAKTARACRPRCAKTLAVKEHPEAFGIELRSGRRVVIDEPS